MHQFPFIVPRHPIVIQFYPVPLSPVFIALPCFFILYTWLRQRNLLSCPRVTWSRKEFLIRQYCNLFRLDCRSDLGGWRRCVGFLKVYWPIRLIFIVRSKAFLGHLSLWKGSHGQLPQDGPYKLPLDIHSRKTAFFDYHPWTTSSHFLELLFSKSKDEHHGVPAWQAWYIGQS